MKIVFLLFLSFPALSNTVFFRTCSSSGRLDFSLRECLLTNFREASLYTTYYVETCQGYDDTHPGSFIACENRNFKSLADALKTSYVFCSGTDINAFVYCINQNFTYFRARF